MHTDCCICTGAPHLGAVTLPVDKIVSGEKVEGWFDLQSPTAKAKNGKPMKAQVCITWTLAGSLFAMPVTCQPDQ